MENKLLNFLNTLRESDLYVPYIYSEGSCYQLYNVVKTIFPEVEAYTNLAFDHIILKYESHFYDIFGIYRKNILDLQKLTPEQHEIASKWSFSRKNLLLLCECPYCEEPITYRINKNKLELSE